MKVSLNLVVLVDRLFFDRFAPPGVRSRFQITSHEDKAEPGVNQGRKATDLIPDRPEDRRMTKQGKTAGLPSKTKKSGLETFSLKLLEDDQ